MNRLLQVEQVTAKGTSYLFQYGVLGVFAALLLLVVWYMEKQRTKRDAEASVEKEKLLQRMAVLETKIEDMQDDFIKKLESIVVENSRVMSKNIEVMEEVKELLIKRQA